MAASRRVLRIDLGSPVPAYRQVMDGLRAQLVSGILAAGDRLPTVRELALDLGLHHNTVAEAYRELAREGWLELARRRGAVVRDRAAPPPAAREASSAWLRRLNELVAQGVGSGVRRDEIVAALRTSARELIQQSAK